MAYTVSDCRVFPKDGLRLGPLQHEMGVTHRDLKPEVHGSFARPRSRL